MQVVMSFFGDQFANGAEIELLGIGKHLTFQEFSEDLLLNYTEEVLSNMDFQSRVTEVGTLLMDQIDK
jgi:UDP:flavonoid glycosyltransferase YjiC (YdhE family)